VTPDQSLVEGLKVETSQSTLPVPAAMVGSDTQHVGATALKSMTPPSSGRMASSVPNLRGDDLFGEEPASGPLADRREAFKNQCLGEGRILPLNLFKTAVLDPSPPRWVPVPKAARYRLVLKDDKGKKMASRETKNPSCPLTGWTFQDERWYSWTVDALTAKGRVVASGGGTFLRLGPDRRKALAEAELKIRFKTTPGSAEERIQLALVHQEFGLYDQAADTLRPLAVQNPGAGGLTRRMNLLDPSRMVTAALPTL
jgi:hypothetical protein